MEMNSFLLLSLTRDILSEGKEVGSIPTLARINGVRIMMFLTQSEHQPPHVHAYFGEFGISVDIRNGRILEGDFPKKKLKLVLDWVKNHQKELLEIWDTQIFRKME